MKDSEVVIALVLIGAGGYLAYKYYFKKKTTAEESPPIEPKTIPLETGNLIPKTIPLETGTVKATEIVQNTNWLANNLPTQTFLNVISHTVSPPVSHVMPQGETLQQLSQRWHVPINVLSNQGGGFHMPISTEHTAPVSHYSPPSHVSPPAHFDPYSCIITGSVATKTWGQPFINFDFANGKWYGMWFDSQGTGHISQGYDNPRSAYNYVVSHGASRVIVLTTHGAYYVSGFRC